MLVDSKTIAALAADYAGRDPRDILDFALREFGPEIAISFAGAESTVLIDMANKLGGKCKVFTLDTGRLHPETYQFLDRIRRHYRLALEVFSPQAEAVQKLV